ncbi:3'-5' exonuclease [Sphingomonas donggukensis]|uniref:3'-5' exonuclease n=1 Tax=Sphingomonas donggukensis TaxID=2949093 RepID=A0ABY4TR33_9SPHN|nr:3'-5' exonuclease [Sphingomonas donggukensis]URW74850.1 3'-5' exonuclease [Sphingomonas donggukensis]
MKTDITTTSRGPRSWIVLDIESAVLDDTAHKRYQAMERWVPGDDKPIRRGYQRSEDPLTCPRWVFQTITTAAMMVLVEDAQGGVDVSRLVTLSAPDHDERAVLAGILQVLADAPADAEICTWMGLAHDIPLLVSGCLRHGLTLPKGWGWLAHGGFHRERHLDLARAYTAGMKMKPIHLAEVLAAVDIPGKITCPPFAVTGLIYAGRWDEVQEACEVDVISTALLLARWRRLTDARAEADAVEDRILRRVAELRAGRGYIGALAAHRHRRFAAKFAKAANDADVLAPWLDQDAA